MLTERRQQVLAALIREYVAHAMPVASRTLVEGYPLGVSSATVRNDLSALEEAGCIRQPHTSAGRVPTDTGYRSFVDRIIDQAGMGEDDEAAGAIRKLREDATEIDELLGKTAELLTRITACLSIVLPARTARLPMGGIGLSTLMQQPEFSRSLVLVPLLRMIEDDSLLVYVNHAAGLEAPSVRIGHENDDESLGNISVVASRFGTGADSGVVAIIGPTRMDYERAIAAVRAAQRELGEI